MRPAGRTSRKGGSSNAAHTRPTPVPDDAGAEGGTADGGVLRRHDAHGRGGADGAGLPRGRGDPVPAEPGGGAADPAADGGAAGGGKSAAAAGGGPGGGAGGAGDERGDALSFPDGGRGDVLDRNCGAGGGGDGARAEGAGAQRELRAGGGRQL